MRRVGGRDASPYPANREKRAPGTPATRAILYGVDFDPADPRNLIYARPPEHGKIFVSSKMSGGALKAERPCQAVV